MKATPYGQLPTVGESANAPRGAIGEPWVMDGEAKIGLLLLALCVLPFLAGFLMQRSRRRAGSESEARREADRRWAALATVSTAAREMTGSHVNPDEVLSSVIGAVTGLGFERSTIYLKDGERFRKVDVPASDRPVPPLIERVVAERQVVRFDRAGHPAGPDLPPDGVAIPIFVGGAVAAVLVAGSTRAHRADDEEIEVLRMVASQASVALESVRRFEEQQEVIDRLEMLDRMKRDWLSTVSHELRTPLTVINGMGRTLEDQWSTLDDATTSDFLARINANAQTLDRVITQLLDFSRLDSGQLEPVTDGVDLSVLLTSVVDRLRPLLRDHALQVDVEPDLSVSADAGLMERIVENLVANAAKYTPAKTAVSVVAHRVDADVVVSVSDEGPGIPPHELSRIGERFFRGGDVMTRETRGTGLGLAVVSEILELHGSRLEVESEVGIGSVFSFRLPLSPDLAIVELDLTTLEAAGASGREHDGS